VYTFGSHCERVATRDVITMMCEVHDTHCIPHKIFLGRRQVWCSSTNWIRFGVIYMKAANRALQIWWFLADTLVPPSEEHVLVRELASLASHLAVRCHEDGVVTLMAFHDPVVRAVIHEAKFAGNTKAWRLLGEVLAAYITATYPGRAVRIIPMPLSGARLRSRGYNQVAMVLKEALPHMPQAVHTRGMLRRADTAPQTTLGKTERQHNVRGVFAKQWFAPKVPKGDAPETVYMLLDDVLTTGATMHEAKKTLRKVYGITPQLLALAH